MATSYTPIGKSDVEIIESKLDKKSGAIYTKSCPIKSPKLTGLTFCWGDTIRKPDTEMKAA